MNHWRRQKRIQAAAREGFRQLLAEEQALKKRATEIMQQGDTRFRAVRAELASTLGTPKRPRDPEPWMVALLRSQLLKQYLEPYNETQQEVRWLKVHLGRLADTLRARQGTLWLVYQEMWGSTYSSQGYGAGTYAKGAADNLAFEIETLNRIPVRVVEVKRETTHAYRSTFSIGPLSDWQVQAQVSEPLDIEILKRKTKGLGLREWVKACWKRGLNPRVYNPWLPHGTEARLGIDYQGNDV